MRVMAYDPYVDDDIFRLLDVERAYELQDLLEHADYVTTQPGGSGAVREVIEYILKNSGRWQRLAERYFQSETDG